ncbi:putative phage abortive infection protein [Maribacter sp. Asnod2-G09]|uniref:putative phage abortive infection protein n=1 Tax=Maribacter sp. Asnod2-G09 TaxID=3160577 RepID=UPI00386F870B
MKKALPEKLSVFAVLTGVLVFIWGLILFLKESRIDFSTVINPERFAQFGDFIGGVIGSIWALAGVILFYLALKEQRKDFATNRKVLNAQTDALKQQIKEFELQREELHETRKVFILQNETLNFQRFESTFFNLLTLQHKITEDINSNKMTTVETKSSYTETKNRNLYGYPANFTTIEGSLQGKEFIKAMSRLYAKIVEDEGLTDYSGFFKQIQSNGYNGLDLYYKNLYSLFKFIDNAEISSEPDDNNRLREQYFDILINQMSEFELILIYNFEDKHIDFRPYFDKYNVEITVNHRK